MSDHNLKDTATVTWQHSGADMEATVPDAGAGQKGVVALPDPPDATVFWRGDGTFATPTGAAGAWGTITGTLSSQTDLQAALDAKLDDSQVDTDTALTADSDEKIPSQKAVKAYVDANAGGSVTPSQIQQQVYLYGVDTGVTNEFAITLDPAPTLVSGSIVVMKSANTNTGITATLAVNGGTPIAIQRDAVNRPAKGDIGPGDLVPLMYDGTVFQLMRHRSTPYIAPMAIPLIADFTATNIGACTLQDDPDALWMHIPNTPTTVNWRLMLQNQPTPPYTATCRMYYSEPAANSVDVGVYFSDGTKLLGIELLAQAATRTLRLEKMNSVTSDNGSVVGISSPFGYSAPVDEPVFLRLRHDGTTLMADYSTDYGDHWINLGSVLVSAWMTPTKIGFGGVCVTTNAANAVELHVSGWAVTAGASF